MFTENLKMAELLEMNPQLILMLPRFNMNLGFGEKKVSEVCESNNVPCPLFILLCNIYTYNNYLPAKKEIQEIDTNALINYLKKSHDYYLNQRLKHIGVHVENIAKEAGDVGSILMKFFTEYKEEAEKLFQSEETTVFPLLRDGKVVGLKNFEETHDGINDKLIDLTNIIIKYLPPTLMNTERINVWLDISQFTKDIEKHTLIEEKILIPYVNYTQRR